MHEKLSESEEERRGAFYCHSPCSGPDALHEVKLASAAPLLVM